MKILIADDDTTFRLLLAAELRGAGCQVDFASDAMQTIMYARRGNPDIIILDVRMPGGTGVEALKKLKASTKTADIPVLVVSGSTEEGIDRTMLALGAARFVRKPVDPATLVSELSAVCRAA